MFGKSKQPSPPAKCRKLKNPCKLCFGTVTAKSGLQCQGACKKWVHFKCLSYTPGKIQDIKKGYIQVKCPCPDCDTHGEKERQVIGAPYFCGKSSCPAGAKPICQTPVCPKNNPIPGSSKHACPEDCTSSTGVKRCYSPCGKIEGACVKSLQRCHSPLKERSQERRCQRMRRRMPEQCEHPCFPGRQRSPQYKRNPVEEILPGCCLEMDLSSECRFLEHKKKLETSTFDVQDTSRDHELSQPRKILQKQCRSPLRDASSGRRCHQERERPLGHRRTSARERSSEHDVYEKRNRRCIQKKSSDVTADRKRNHAKENLIERSCTAREKIQDGKSGTRPTLQQCPTMRKHPSLEERLLEHYHSPLRLSKCPKHSTERQKCSRNHNPPEKVLTDTHSPLQQSSVECFPLTTSASSGSKHAQQIKSNSEALTPDKNRRSASKDFGGQTKQKKSTSQSKELSSYEKLKKRRITESKLPVTGHIVHSPDSIGRNVERKETSRKDSPICKTASLIRRILNSKSVQFPSIHKKASNTACLEFSQNMPSFVSSECRQLYRSCSIEATSHIRPHRLIESGISSELKSTKLCKSDSFLLRSCSESRNVIFNAMDHVFGTVDQFQNQIRELMGKVMDVFK